MIQPYTVHLDCAEFICFVHALPLLPYSSAVWLPVDYLGPIIFMDSRYTMWPLEIDHYSADSQMIVPLVPILLINI